MSQARARGAHTYSARALEALWGLGGCASVAQVASRAGLEREAVLVSLRRRATAGELECDPCPRDPEDRYDRRYWLPESAPEPRR